MGIARWCWRCRTSCARRSRDVEVWERFDGTLTVCGASGRLEWAELTKAAHAEQHIARRRAKRRKPIVNNKVSKPTAKQRPPAFGKAARHAARG